MRGEKIACARMLTRVWSAVVDNVHLDLISNVSDYANH